MTLSISTIFGNAFKPGRFIGGVTPEAMEGEVLLEALVAETHDLAACVAAVTGAANALAQGAKLKSPASCRNFLPHTQILAKIIPLTRTELEPLRSIGKRLVGLLADTAFAVRSIEDLLSKLEGRGSGHSSPGAVHSCAVLWRTLAADLHEFVNCLEPETRWRVNGQYSENSLALARALREVAGGQASCIDASGEIARPYLPQLRRARRYALQQNCRIHDYGKVHHAFAVDISTGGIGLTKCPALPLKQQVQVELSSGRRLSGSVVWSKAGRVGIKFDDPLPAGDPILG